MPQPFAPLLLKMSANDTLTRTIDRLHAEFDGRYSRARIGRVLRRCVTDLAGSPAGAMPELTERLARQRLLDAQSRTPAIA